MFKKKILIVCPVVPYPENGAEQSDRANGIRQLLRLGFDVKIIAKRKPNQKDSDIDSFTKTIDSTNVITIPYKYTLSECGLFKKMSIILKRLSRISYLDGAAFEYSDPEIQEKVKNEIENWKPDIVWFEYTYLWPLYNLVIKNNIPIVTRSLNFEPSHFLDEDGKTVKNIIKSLPKYISERKVIKLSNLIFAITPKEEKIYKEKGAKKVFTLPLRGLHLLKPRLMRQKEDFMKGPINLFFMGSTYNVYHNREAARFILEELAPRLFVEFGNKIIINIIGAKLPVNLLDKVTLNVKYHGFVNDLDVFLSNMDCAIVPSLYGAGMQQKIFEPLMRGFPTIVSRRGLAEYPFIKNKEVLCADSVDDFVLCLKKIIGDYDFMITLGVNANLKSKILFSSDVIDSLVSKSLNYLIDNNRLL